MNPNPNATKPSTLLKSRIWMVEAMHYFHHSVDTCKEIVDNQMKIKANELMNTLLYRFDCHIKRRIKANEKHNHWILEWSKLNLPVVIAIMVLFDHFKVDVSYSDERVTLLGHSHKFKAVSNKNNDNIQGAYLYYENHMRWIRHGKVTGRGFIIRNMEHIRRAQANRLHASSESRFYLRYPHSKGVRHGSRVRKGFF